MSLIPVLLWISSKFWIEYDKRSAVFFAKSLRSTKREWRANHARVNASVQSKWTKIQFQNKIAMFLYFWKTFLDKFCFKKRKHLPRFLPCKESLWQLAANITLLSTVYFGLPNREKYRTKLERVQLCLENSNSQSCHKRWERSQMDGKPMRSQIKNTI